MAAVRKLRKCAKFVASLFTDRKSKGDSTVEAIRCIKVAVEEEFEFDVDPEVIKRGCQLVYPVFGREISEFNNDEDGQDRESLEESEGEIEYGSWEPDLSRLNDDEGDRDEKSSTDESESEKSAGEEFKPCLWKPKLSELSSGPPVDMRLLAWEIESILSRQIDQTVCSLKQERKGMVSRRSLQHLFRGETRKLAKEVRSNLNENTSIMEESELETSMTMAEEFEPCSWKPKLSELSSAPPVDMRLFVWKIESKLNRQIDQTVCSLKQERKSKVPLRSLQHLFIDETKKLAKEVRNNLNRSVSYMMPIARVSPRPLLLTSF